MVEPADSGEPKENLVAELRQMLFAFWTSPRRNGLFLLGLAMITVIGLTAWMQIRLNAWNRPFYDALTRKDLVAFKHQLGIFAEIACVLLFLNVTQTWLNQRTRLALRRGLVEDLFSVWLVPQRAIRLANSGSIGQNPDQRLAADAQHLVDLMTDLGLGLLQAGLLLTSFIGVLWALSDGMFVWIGPYLFNPPGFMVWCALLYACTASTLSWAVGRPLIRLNAERYAREANLRFELVRVAESVEAIAIYGGEASERTRLDAAFGQVYQIYRQIVGATTRLTWVTAGYGWFTIVAPILVAMPTYFAGKMTFGEMMMIVGAFNQVQSSLRWFVDNFSAIADWRATMLRVAGFRETMISMDRLGEGEERIAVNLTTEPVFVIENMKVAGPTGELQLSEPKVDLRAGQRVLIVGGHGEGKTLFFRALIGLWPWGSGSITRPARDQVIFMPARAYLPTGTLRDCISYPFPGTTFPDAAIREALHDVGLGRLVDSLDKFQSWDRKLRENEKHCLAFARTVLQRPEWVVIDDALSFLDRSSRHRIEALFMKKLTGTGVIVIGQNGAQTEFYTAPTLTLTLDPKGRSFVPLNNLPVR